MTCEHCEAREGTEQECGTVLCDSCRDNEAEAAHERFLEDYYGGSGPVTLNERYQEAVRERAELRRRD